MLIVSTGGPFQTAETLNHAVSAEVSPASPMKTMSAWPAATRGDGFHLHMHA